MKSFRIGNRVLSDKTPVFVIAEAGVNHNGNLKLAKKLVAEAKRAGADCIKFQTFQAEELVTLSAPKADYQLQTTDPSESQFAMLKKLELPKMAYEELMKECSKENILFLSTPYSFKDVDFLDELGVPGFKIASGQLTEYSFLAHVAKKKKPIFISTGMCTLEDIRGAVKTFRDEAHNNFVLLQCTTNYPSHMEDAHLRVIPALKLAFQINVGYSDHTVGDTAILGAVALGACVIEKHFTLDRRTPGPDHSSSMEPREFAELVKKIRNLEKALGQSGKTLTPMEAKNALGMKRSITSTQLIKRGTTIQLDMLTFKRPATGLHPNLLNKVIGKRAAKDISPDTFLSEEMVESFRIPS